MGLELELDRDLEKSMHYRICLCSVYLRQSSPFIMCQLHNFAEWRLRWWYK